MKAVIFLISMFGAGIVGIVGIASSEILNEYGIFFFCVCWVTALAVGLHFSENLKSSHGI